MSNEFEDRFHSHPEFEAHIANLCARPGMFVVPASLATVCAYMDGFDVARDRGPLVGLREWLVTRVRGGTNLHWTGLITIVLSVEMPGDEKAIETLGRLLTEFFKHRRESGIAKIFQDHNRWLVRQKWYDGPLRGKGHGLE